MTSSGSDFNAFAYLTVNPAVRSDRLVLSELKLHMKAFSHDVAEMWVQSVDDTDPVRWSTGVPLSIHYGRAPNQVDTFYGYVLDVQRNWGQVTRTSPMGRMMRVTALGASYPMKEDLTTLFHQMTTDQIATALARSHYFDTDIPPTDWAWPTKSSSGESEWTFLVELAKASGLIMYCHGTQFRMYDPLTPLQRKNVTVPHFYEKDSGRGQSVLSFDTDLSEVSSEEGRRKRTRVVRGIDALGQSIYATDAGPVPALGQRSLAPAFSETVTDLVTVDQRAANALLPARGLENRFYHRAKAVLSGDPRITQQSPVVIEGLGPRDSGIWQVLEAVHHIRKRWYSTDVVLGRDSDFDNGKRPGLPDGVLRDRLDPYASALAPPPPSVLANGQWRAGWRTSNAA
jgi:hypothetical protein